LPIGLVLDPSQVPLAEFQDILTTLTCDGDNTATAWLRDPLLELWYTAVRRDPDAFAIPLRPYSDFRQELDPLPGLPSVIQDSIKHLEWSVTHHYILDWSLASCATEQLLKRLNSYLAKVFADSQTPPPDQPIP
jgi:hypothetical protein